MDTDLEQSGFPDIQRGGPWCSTGCACSSIASFLSFPFRQLFQSALVGAFHLHQSSAECNCEIIQRLVLRADTT